LNKQVIKLYFFFRKIFSVRARFFRFYCKILNKKFRNQAHILEYLATKSIEELSNLYYKYNSVVELEHQVGRFINMNRISKELKSSDKYFSIVEFGTYKGLGLLLLDRAFSRQQIGNSITYVGIDGFNGLPESSTIWKKNDFSDITYDECLRNLHQNISSTVEVKLITVHLLIYLETKFSTGLVIF
jgi:hypothetical protein